eukprot:1491282-Prymnesium_polylepis.1
MWAYIASSCCRCTVARPSSTATVCRSRLACAPQPPARSEEEHRRAVRMGMAAGAVPARGGAGARGVRARGAWGERARGARCVRGACARGAWGRV